MIHLRPKAQKPQQPSPQYFDISKSLSCKISPIPIIYRKLQNDKKMRTRLVIKGFKSFSKFSACGEDTQRILENLSKSRNMKFIRKLEFDPYLCEKSYIKLFGKALRRFNDIRDLNLVIRRLDYVDESNILGPFMIRLIRLKKLRLELNKIEKLYDEGFIKLARMYGKLYSLRECEQVVLGMDHISQYASMHTAIYGCKLKLCTKFKKIGQRGNLFIRSDPNCQGLEEKVMKKIKCGNHFRDIEFYLSLQRGW